MSTNCLYLLLASLWWSISTCQRQDIQQLKRGRISSVHLKSIHFFYTVFPNLKDGKLLWFWGKNGSDAVDAGNLAWISRASESWFPFIKEDLMFFPQTFFSSTLEQWLVCGWCSINMLKINEWHHVMEECEAWTVSVCGGSSAFPDRPTPSPSRPTVRGLVAVLTPHGRREEAYFKMTRPRSLSFLWHWSLRD